MMQKKVTWYTINVKFLRPRLVNILPTLILLFLLILWEHAALPTGGYVLVRYVPVFVFVDYVKLQYYGGALLFIGFFLIVYVVVSLGVAILSSILRHIKTP
ncbi:hypothetical protein A2Z00_00270 [Candidatus Gottesmanbacteria bacterium RBG_13_45_10]|uniref:ABC transmembrane type-1 domain-containing protein n=1 Tax=Candidatus Gottesmanbacteria bacterium RBG_13_45_10 TaxID=1798370 RepID=A0A1F5ZHT7_9BACT|nr:MAG: hypothetical protein A2Z00_00270 [Candidatus Gottesmanbacteria bacterium RBG_13_45_10]